MGLELSIGGPVKQQTSVYLKYLNVVAALVCRAGIVAEKYCPSLICGGINV